MSLFIFSGRKQSGKSTSCYFLFNKFLERSGSQARIDDNGNVNSPGENIHGLNVEMHKPFLDDLFIKAGCKIYSFADPLKKSIGVDIFNLEPMYLYGDNKQKSQNTHLSWNDVSEDIQKECRRSDLKGERNQPMTYRQFLEVIGTCIFRRLDPDCWARATYRLIDQEGYSNALITDARFPNEISLGTEHGGISVRLTRDIFPNEKKTEPEMALDEFPLGEYTYIINNENMEKEQKETELLKILNNHVR